MKKGRARYMAQPAQGQSSRVSLVSRCYADTEVDPVSLFCAKQARAATATDARDVWWISSTTGF